MVLRTASPNGSRPRLPTVHRPKVNWWLRSGTYLSLGYLLIGWLSFARGDGPSLEPSLGLSFVDDAGRRQPQAPRSFQLMGPTTSPDLEPSRNRPIRHRHPRGAVAPRLAPLELFAPRVPPATPPSGAARCAPGRAIGWWTGGGALAYAYLSSRPH